MTTIRRSAAAEARQEIGSRLRQLRKSAGLTGQAIADATGQHVTRVSRIENGVQPPTERNIRDWCVACGAAGQAGELIAAARTVESAYLEWARQSRSGLKHLGTLHSIATYRRTTLFRIHEPIVLPGIFQTESYTRRMLAFWYEFLGAPDDTDATVAMKAQRSAAALKPAKRIDVVLGEQALRTRYGTAAEHAEQLTHLLSLMRLPFVSVAVIPAAAQRRALATIGFWIFDDNAVALETPSAAIKVTRPQEIALYAKMFSELHEEAAHGRVARQLIAEVMAELLSRRLDDPIGPLQLGAKDEVREPVDRGDAPDAIGRKWEVRVGRPRLLCRTCTGHPVRHAPCSARFQWRHTYGSICAEGRWLPEPAAMES